MLLHCVVTQAISAPIVGSQVLCAAIYALMGLGIGAGWFSPEQMRRRRA